jgi:hypothetical protein
MPVGQVPLSEQVIVTVDNAAKQKGLSRAAYMRQALMERLARDGFTVPSPVPVVASEKGNENV